MLPIKRQTIIYIYCEKEYLIMIYSVTNIS